MVSTYNFLTWHYRHTPTIHPEYRYKYATHVSKPADIYITLGYYVIFVSAAICIRLLHPTGLHYFLHPSIILSPGATSVLVYT